MIDLKIVAEDASTITLGWPQAAGAYGFRLFQDTTALGVSWDAAKTSWKVTKPTTPCTFMLVEMAQADTGSLAYPPATTPPPPTTFDPHTAWQRRPWTADASAATLDPNSQALIDRWKAPFTLGGVSYTTGNIRYPNVCTNAYSMAWVVGKQGDPLYDIVVWKYGVKTIKNVPIPMGTKPSPDGDKHLTVFDAVNSREITLWLAEFQGSHNPGGWAAGSGDVYSPLGSNPAPGTGSNAAGLPPFGVSLWPEEIKAGKIDHVLAFSTVEAAPPKNPAHRYPAVKDGDGRGTPQDLPYSAWLRMPQSAVLNTGWAQWVKTIFIALQQHGMYLMDQGGTLGIAGINPINGGVKWSDVGMGTGGSAGFPGDFPWTKMQVLVPPSP